MLPGAVARLPDEYGPLVAAGRSLGRLAALREQFQEDELKAAGIIAIVPSGAATLNSFLGESDTYDSAAPRGTDRASLRLGIEPCSLSVQPDF